MCVCSLRMDVDENRVAVGPQQGVCCTDWEAQICILCQEEQEVQGQAPAMVLTACVQRSTVLTQNRGKTLSPKGKFILSPKGKYTFSFTERNYVHVMLNQTVSFSFLVKQKAAIPC